MRDEFFKPKARSLSDDNNVICPYCKHEYQPDTETYSEDNREEECGKCGKKYHLYQSFSVEHTTKPDCDLNGESHDWDVVSSRHPQYQRCGNCDKWRKTPPAPVSEEVQRG